MRGEGGGLGGAGGVGGGGGGEGPLTPGGVRGGEGWSGGGSIGVVMCTLESLATASPMVHVLQSPSIQDMSPDDHLPNGGTR